MIVFTNAIKNEFHQTLSGFHPKVTKKTFFFQLLLKKHKKPFQNKTKIQNQQIEKLKKQQIKKQTETKKI